MTIHASSDVNIDGDLRTGANTAPGLHTKYSTGYRARFDWYFSWPVGSGNSLEWAEIYIASGGGYGNRMTIHMASDYGWQNSIGTWSLQTSFGFSSNGGAYHNSVDTIVKQSMGQYAFEAWSRKTNTTAGLPNPRFSCRIQNTTRNGNPFWVTVQTWGSSYGGTSLLLGGPY